MYELDKINETKEKAINKVIEYSTPRTIASFMELTIAIICSVGIQFVSFGLNMDAFTEWSFYVKTACLTVGVFLMFRSVINAMYPRTEKRENVINAKNEYNELNKQKELSLKEYLQDFNRETKMTVYIASINKKIAKLERKLIKTMNANKIAKYESMIGEDEIIENGKVIKKATGLKQKLASSFLLEHIDHIYVKYPIVNYSDFVDETPEGDSSRLTTRANYNKAFNIASFNKMWCYVLTTMMMTVSVAGYSNSGGVYFFTSLVMTCCMIAVRIASAMMKAPQLYDATITKSYNDRIYVLKRYIEWKKNHPTKTMMDDLAKQLDKEAQEKWQQKAQSTLEKKLKELNIN